MIKKEISIAPMLDWTDNFFRSFIRLISHHAFLYTEMIVEQALWHGDYNHLLTFDSCQHPIALQLGGSTPQIMAHCAKLGEKFGYDEININAGCPSERVQAGSFGACLMAKPELVARCIEKMTQATKLPVSVKTRIALEETKNAYKDLTHFIQTTSQAGCQKFIIHARNARLKGLTPKENREKIPLNYELVYRLKEDFPHLFIEINGNITSLESIKQHLEQVDGVMIGRRAYAEPYFLANIDYLFYNDPHPILTRKEIIAQILPSLQKEIEKGRKPLSMLRHIMGLYWGTPLSKEFKKIIMSNDLKMLYSFLEKEDYSKIQ